VFNRSKLHDSILRLTDLYSDHGYANVNISPLTSKNSEAQTISLNLDIEQGVKVFVEKIKISGNTKTRDKVIRREIPLAEGEQYSASKIKEANRRLRNLGYFEEVNLTTAPGSAANQSVLNVDVKEQATGTFSVGAGYSSVDKLILQGSVTQNNFLGRGYKLNFSAAYSSRSQTFSLGLTDPYFLDSDWTVGMDAYKTERRYDSYDQFRTGGSVRAGHSIGKYSKAFLSYRYEQQEYQGVDLGVSSRFFGNRTVSSITGEIVRNSTDYHPDPSRGGMSNFSLEYAGLIGTENFLKAIVEHRQFYPLFWKTVFSVHGKVGYVTPTSGGTVSISERFFLGGIRTMRGFETFEVGPKEGTVFIGGEKMAYFNFEYTFPIIKSLGLKGLLFYDTGNAWLGDEGFFTDMRNSVGAGIRWNSPLGPLRLEWGYNLAPRDNEKQSVFEFSIGSAF
jgi:outer membrane protein insertion porin family